MKHLNKILFLSFLFLSFNFLFGQNIRYVNINHPNPYEDGTSWLTPYKYLQDALAESHANQNITEIRVADGTYYPDINKTSHPNHTNDRNISFTTRNNLKVLGGFKGEGHFADIRDIKTYVTILSGEINDLNTIDDNSIHILRVYDDFKTSLLDGFTFEKGNANGGSGSHSGGAIYVTRTTSATISNCIFRNNNSINMGGAIYIELAIPQWNIPEIEILNCTFENNTALKGGAIGSRGRINPSIIKDCIIRNNNAELGGAIYLKNYGLTLSNNIISNNIATLEGGAVYYKEIENGRLGELNIINNTFYNNSAQIGTGFAATSSLVDKFSKVKIVNSIFWDQGNSEIHTPNNEILNLSYSNVKGGYHNTELNNTYVNPYFVETNPGNGLDLRLQPHSVCINTGNNNVELLPENDIDGNSRIICSFVDKGAYENTTANCNIIYVNKDKPNGGNGESWNTAYNNLSTAIEAAPNNSQIWIADGTYIPSSHAANSYKEYVELQERENKPPTYQQFVAYINDNSNKCFFINKQLALYGGFEGIMSETSLDDRDWEQNETIISGNIGDLNDNTDNCYFVIHAETNRNVHIDGVQIKDATINHNDGDATNGLFISNTNIGIYNCLFEDNPSHLRSYSYGQIVVKKISIQNTTFKNTLSYAGAGVRINVMHLVKCVAELNGCKIINNDVSTAGINLIVNTNCKINNCEFLSNNPLTSNTNLITCSNSNLEINNSIFGNNPGDLYKSLIEVTKNGKLDINFSTFYNNFSNSSSIGGSINNTEFGTNTTNITNSIFWSSTNNTKQLSGNGISASYSNIMTTNGSLYTGTNNINTNPYFVNAAQEDFHLQSTTAYFKNATNSWVLNDQTVECSDCINAGHPSHPSNEPDGDKVNMGAYGNTPFASKACNGKSNHKSIFTKTETPEGINIYPNPFKSVINIDLNLENDSYLFANIYNLTGKLIKQLYTTNKTKGYIQLQWDGLDQYSNKLPEGIYLLKIENNQQISTHKLILKK